MNIEEILNENKLLREENEKLKKQLENYIMKKIKI